MTKITILSKNQVVLSFVEYQLISIRRRAIVFYINQTSLIKFRLNIICKLRLFQILLEFAFNKINLGTYAVTFIKSCTIRSCILLQYITCSIKASFVVTSLPFPISPPQLFFQLQLLFRLYLLQFNVRII